VVGVACFTYSSVTAFLSAGTIFLQSIPSSRSLHEDSPSISEGWGGKVSDYRIAVSKPTLYLPDCYLRFLAVLLVWVQQIILIGQKFNAICFPCLVM